MKVKSAKLDKIAVKPKKIIAKPNWEEDDVSGGNKVLPEKLKKRKKTKKTEVSSENMVTISAKSKKIKKNKTKKSVTNSSDDEDYDAPIDKLKEIDPEFYKVMV